DVAAGAGAARRACAAAGAGTPGLDAGIVVIGGAAGRPAHPEHDGRDGHSKRSTIDVHDDLLISSAAVAGLALSVIRDVVQPKVVIRALNELDLDLGDVRGIDAALEAVRAWPLR